MEIHISLSSIPTQMNPSWFPQQRMFKLQEIWVFKGGQGFGYRKSKRLHSINNHHHATSHVSYYCHMFNDLASCLHDIYVCTNPQTTRNIWNMPMNTQSTHQYHRSIQLCIQESHKPSQAHCCWESNWDNWGCCLAHNSGQGNSQRL